MSEIFKNNNGGMTALDLLKKKGTGMTSTKGNDCLLNLKQTIGNTGITLQQKIKDLTT